MTLDRVSTIQIRWLAIAAMLGGLLWMPYGIFEMLEPWGRDTEYRDERGYEVIIDAPLFAAYSLPGGLALLLTSLGLVGVLAMLGLPAQRAGRIGRVLAHVALALALLSILGILVLFDPLFTSARIFGSLALGVATLLVGIDARARGVAASWIGALLIMGLMGLLLLPLWPLVFAVHLAPEGAGAAYIGVFGLGWTLTGYRLHAGAR
jgi:FtsH-binding integral membrane protein